MCNAVGVSALIMNWRRVMAKDSRVLAKSVLSVIKCLSTSQAVTDTIWLTDMVTVVDELSHVASALGATDAEIEDACTGDK